LTANTAADSITTFNSPGTFTPPVTQTVEVLVIGGGGGTCSTSSPGQSGGGGAGALHYNNAFPVTGGSPISVTIGAGGPGGAAPSGSGTKGSNTIFGSVTAEGGGASAQNSTGGPGGSGSGDSSPTSTPSTGPVRNQVLTLASGVSGGTPGTNSPALGWGNPGGRGAGTDTLPAGAAPQLYLSGGGGGAGGAGGHANAPGSPRIAGVGGAGLTFSISGSAVGYAGGGSGGSGFDPPVSGSTLPAPASDGGGSGGYLTSDSVGVVATVGTANRGGGGGGGAYVSGGAPFQSGAAGGSGVVIVRYNTSWLIN
jgi:hypothetical protein